MPDQDPTLLTQTYAFRDLYTIHWTRLGPPSGPPVIFIHGTPWSSRLWAPYARALSRSHSVYLFDNPGYGESMTFPTPQGEKVQAEDSSLAVQAQCFAGLYYDVWKFRRPADDDSRSKAGGAQQGEQRVLPHVIAHDNAGLVSLRAILQHGCRFRSLCLIDVVAVSPFGHPLFTLLKGNQAAFEEVPETMFDGIVRGYVRGAAHRRLPPATEDALVAVWLSRGKQGQKAFIRQLVQAAGRNNADVEGRYAEVVASGVPVRVIWGRDDTWLPLAKGEQLAKMLGGKTELVVVPEAAHLIHLDQPEQLMAELVRFVLGVEHGSIAA